MLSTPEERKELLSKLRDEWEENRDLIEEFVDEFIRFNGLDKYAGFDEIIYKGKTYFVGCRTKKQQKYFKRYLYLAVLDEIITQKGFDVKHGERKPDKWYSVENEEYAKEIRADLIRQLEFFPCYLCEIDKIKECADYEY